MISPRRLRTLCAYFACAAVLAASTAPVCSQETGTMSLDACIALGLQRQPAIAAAQSSLSASVTGYQSLNNMRFAGLFARDIPVRRQQACLGVSIMSAQLKQVEWETRYAVTRNYFSVIYARMQLQVTEDLVRRLEDAYKTAEKLLGKAEGAIKITRNDLDALKINLELVKVKRAQASVGVLRATAALREAIGVGPEYVLNVDPDAPLPEIVPALNKSELIATALANRGEMAMVSAASEVSELEITAQSRVFFKPTSPTFASGSDIHAQPIPQGVANGEYRPGAIGLEMPVFLIGKRGDRMDRARDFFHRSLAVVDKTQNLISLEVEANYLKWLEAMQQVDSLRSALTLAEKLALDVQKRFNEGNVAGSDYLTTRALVDQTRAALNEALYNHALALAALERTTAGGYRLPAK